MKNIDGRSNRTQDAYISYNLDDVLRKKSASGGVFSAIAKYVISNGGVVYGASLNFEDSEVIVKHIKAETIEELEPILNSKYVQSDASSCYTLIREQLKTNRMIVFSGTSCQIKGLYSYLEGEDTTNLYTIDLICHGVPGEMLFKKYINYLEQKNNGKIIDFAFRKKGNGENFYILTYKIVTSNGCKLLETNLNDSAYYRMFMAGESYRKSCYRCEFSSIDKPADITIGDYYEAKDDYPELFEDREDGLKMEDGLSCILVNNKKGSLLLQKTKDLLYLREVDVIKVQNSHRQLRYPLMYTYDRFRYFKLFREGGYGKIEKYMKRRDYLKDAIKKLVRL